MKAKPDCVGEKFGYLTVISKAKKDNQTFWELRCDCGNIVHRLRSQFDNNKPYNPSCGCKKREAAIANGRKRANPSPVGNRFGFLTCIREAEVVKRSGRSRRLFELLCDCGKTIFIPRGDFDGGKKQISCGCARHRDNKPIRPKKDVAGQRFGSLVAVELSGKRDVRKQPTWKLLCNCGNVVYRSLKRLNLNEHNKVRNHCGERKNHPEACLHYPPAPIPYPGEAGLLLEKYLPLCTLPFEKIRTDIEDEKRDRLIRVCWIITYRRWQGEEISELYEKRIISKHLRFASIDVFRNILLEEHGGLYHDSSNKKREIGGVMTDRTLLDYPVLEIPETSGINCISSNVKPFKKIKFKRF